MDEMVTKQRLTFDAIGVLAAIDIERRICACIVKDGSIGLPEMIDMSMQLKRKFPRKHVKIFLDNREVVLMIG